MNGQEYNRVYIAGPMSGLHLSNFPAFDRARKILENLGYEVVSPADLNRQVGYDPTDPLSVDVPPSRGEFMKVDLPKMLECDVVVLLPGYQHSAGVSIERDLAQYVDIPEAEFDQFIGLEPDYSKGSGDGK